MEVVKSYRETALLNIRKNFFIGNVLKITWPLGKAVHSHTAKVMGIVSTE